MNNLKYTTYLVRISFQQKNHRDHSFIHKPKLGISVQASMWACKMAWTSDQTNKQTKNIYKPMTFKQFWWVQQERLQMLEIPHMTMKCKAQRPKISKFGLVETSRDLSDFQDTTLLVTLVQKTGRKMLKHSLLSSYIHKWNNVCFTRDLSSFS